MARKRSPGEGTIYFSKTQNLWVSQITLPNGKRKTKYDKSQKVVQAWLLTQRTALRQGLLVEEDKMTYGDFLSRYFNDVATHTLRPKSLESYESLIRMHIQPEIGMIRLSALNPVHLQNLYSSKLNQGLSRRTVHYIHAIIHRSLNQALKWGLIYRNVADLAESPKVERKIPQTLSAEEVKKFLLVVKEDRLYPLYLLAVTTGMREGELLALDFESVDFFKNTIHVKRSAHQLIGKGIVISEPKTEKSKRTIAVPEFVMDILYEHLEKSGRKGGLICQTSSGLPIGPRNLVREFKAHLVEAGLPDIRFHDLRHTAATLLLTEGVHPKVVQEMLGHSQISLTLDTYSHTIPNMQTEAAEKMNTLLR
jgi:integrase